MRHTVQQIGLAMALGGIILSLLGLALLALKVDAGAFAVFFGILAIFPGTAIWATARLKLSKRIPRPAWDGYSYQIRVSERD